MRTGRPPAAVGFEEDAVDRPVEVCPGVVLEVGSKCNVTGTDKVVSVLVPIDGIEVCGDTDSDVVAGGVEVTGGGVIIAVGGVETGGFTDLDADGAATMDASVVPGSVLGMIVGVLVSVGSGVADVVTDGGSSVVRLGSVGSRDVSESCDGSTAAELAAGGGVKTGVMVTVGEFVSLADLVGVKLACDGGVNSGVMDTAGGLVSLSDNVDLGMAVVCGTEGKTTAFEDEDPDDAGVVLPELTVARSGRLVNKSVTLCEASGGSGCIVSAGIVALFRTSVCAGIIVDVISGVTVGRVLGSVDNGCIDVRLPVSMGGRTRCVVVLVGRTGRSGVGSGRTAAEDELSRPDGSVSTGGMTDGRADDKISGVVGRTGTP